MTLLYRLGLVGLALLACLDVSLAQTRSGAGQVVQTGRVLARHMTMWATSGVVMDAGSPAGGLKGTNPSGLGITNTGTPFCITDGPTSAPYHQLCLGANSNGFGVISYTASMGATALPLQCIINGVTTNNCLSGSGGGGGGVITQGTVLANHITSYADATGLLIKDSGYASTLLNPFTGDSGAGGVAGLVPAPPAGATATGRVLGASGTWILPTAGPLTLTGVVTGTGTGTVNTSFTANSVTNATLAQMSALTIKGNNTGGAANAVDLTAAQTTAMLNPFTGDAGSGGIKGLVPAPAAGDAAAGKFLAAGGGFAVPAGTGSITWPTSASIVVSNGTNTPAGLAPVNNDLVYATGGAWAVLPSANSSVLVTSAGGVPSLGTTLPSGLTVPAPVLSGTVLGTYTLGGTPSIAASALTGVVGVANGGTGLASGTSGGVLAFTGSTTLSSSGVLTANLPVIGGGAGVAPTVGTRSGNTTKYVTTTGALTNGNCVAIDASGNMIDSGGACGGSGGSGTVTSVDFSVPASSIFSVSGNPIVNSGTIALATTGTSGGVPYFSSTSQLSSSAVLTANLPVIGGGAGVAPSVGTRSGNTTKFVTSIGTLTTGDVASWDASGNAIDAGIVAANVVMTTGTQTITGNKTLSGATVLSGTVSGAALTTYLAAPAAIGTTTPAAGAFTTLSATGSLTTNVTGSTQCLQVNSSGVVSGAGGVCGSGTGITWPASGSIVVSNGTNTPASLTPIVNRLAVGTAGPTWSTLATANASVLVTGGTGVPSLSTTLPVGLTIPGFAPLASPVLTGVPAAPTTAQSDNSTALATTAFVKSQRIPQAIGWIAGQNPNNVPVFTVSQAMTVQAITGRVEVANGSAASVTINKAASGTACSSGTVLHSGSFNANGTAATNQTLTITTTTLAVGDTVCLQTGGGANWTSGNAIGGLTIFVTPS